MPLFKKPLESQKLFKRKSPSVLRVRRSAVMNDLGGHKQTIASTPMNRTSNIASSNNSSSQLSPITQMLKNIDEFVDTHHTSKDINVTRTNKCVNDNKFNRRSKSLENLSENIQFKQKKHASPAIGGPKTGGKAGANTSTEPATIGSTSDYDCEYGKDSETFNQIGPKMRGRAGSDTSPEPAAIGGTSLGNSTKKSRSSTKVSTNESIPVQPNFIGRLPVDWCCRQQHSELPINGMQVNYTMRNLQTEAGTISYGQLILAPKYQKPTKISKKHCITYKVEKGEALVKVQTKQQIGGVGWEFHIPLGAEYTIINLKDEPLILTFVKVSCSRCYL